MKVKMDDGELTEIYKKLNNHMINLDFENALITNPDLRRTLRKIEGDNILIKIRTELSYNYKLNPEPISEAN